MSSEATWGNLPLFNEMVNSSNESGLPVLCTFKELENIWDFIALFEHKECLRQTVGYTVFLSIANLLVFIFGLIGNLLVICITVFKLKTKTASSIFIFNLAVADLLKILCCIPFTVVANLIIPWVFSETVCKISAYSQGISVVCSVYSLLAISFDRFRAIHRTLGITPNISVRQAYIIVSVIWLLGILITLPWAVFFTVNYQNPYKHDYPELTSVAQYNLPFCQEVWDSKSQEAVYFMLVPVFACFILPFGVITVCNVIIWRQVQTARKASTSFASSGLSHLHSNGFQKRHNKRKMHVLKMLTGLNIAYVVCWLPLYLVMGRVKLFYTDSFSGGLFEQWLVPILVPAAQLLGNVNSCVNPVLYALLNQKFQQSFNLIFRCRWCRSGSQVYYGEVQDENNSIHLVVAIKSKTRSTQV